MPGLCVASSHRLGRGHRSSQGSSAPAVVLNALNHSRSSHVPGSSQLRASRAGPAPMLQVRGGGTKSGSSRRVGQPEPGLGRWQRPAPLPHRPPSLAGSWLSAPELSSTRGGRRWCFPGTLLRRKTPGWRKQSGFHTTDRPVGLRSEEMSQRHTTNALFQRRPTQSTQPPALRAKPTCGKGDRRAGQLVGQKRQLVS